MSSATLARRPRPIALAPARAFTLTLALALILALTPTPTLILALIPTLPLTQAEARGGLLLVPRAAINLGTQARCLPPHMHIFAARRHTPRQYICGAPPYTSARRSAPSPPHPTPAWAAL